METVFSAQLWLASVKLKSSSLSRLSSLNRCVDLKRYKTSLLPQFKCLSTNSLEPLRKAAWTPTCFLDITCPHSAILHPLYVRTCCCYFETSRPCCVFRIPQSHGCAMTGYRTPRDRRTSHDVPLLGANIAAIAGRAGTCAAAGRCKQCMAI